MISTVFFRIFAILQIQVFLNELNEKKEEEEPIDDLIDELIEKIIHQITINLERYLFLKLVQPFKFTDCSECHVPLSHENYKPLCRYSDHDNGLCDECDDRKKMDAYLKSRMEFVNSLASGPPHWSY